MNPSHSHLHLAEPLRVLSESERARVSLVRSGEGLRVLKVERSVAGQDAGVLLGRYERLSELSRGPGLLPILGCGLTGDGGVWLLLPPGDNLPGLPGLETEAGIEQYTPMTLRMRTQEAGPAGARQVAVWGQRLCAGLGLLHGSGLVHRNVQPANVVFVEGEPRLGDYSRVGEVGSRVQTKGMEGFDPVQGGDDEGGDLHALGRTLYEAWTGRDRMEFPSLSRRVLESPEWGECGLGLNDVILKSGRGRGAGGFGSAEEFGKALLEVESGKRGIKRRVWLKGAVVAGVGVAAGWAVLGRREALPPLKWERVVEGSVEPLQSLRNRLAIDWQQRRIHYILNTEPQTTVRTINADTFKRESTVHEEVLQDVGMVAWHPLRRSILMLPESGKVWEWKHGVKGATVLANGPVQVPVSGTPYWNRLTRRVGVFGGYGYFRVYNQRSELDIEKGQWVEVEPHDLRKAIWPRGGPLCSVDSGGGHLHVAAGAGSSLGQQGKREPGLGEFNGQFHMLDDVWSLDLKTGEWLQLLPLGRLGLGRVVMIFRHPRANALIVVLCRELHVAQPDRARAYMVELDRPGRLIEMGMDGTAPVLAEVHGYEFDPKDGQLLVIAGEAVYRVTM